jgi:ParB family chromosome partitioning protein
LFAPSTGPAVAAPDTPNAAPGGTGDKGRKTRTGRPQATGERPAGRRKATAGAKAAAAADGVSDTTGPGDQFGADGGLVEVPGAEFAMLAVDRIVPNPRQPRQVFDEDALRELADSIKEVGLLQPVVVRPAQAGQYELVMGERRWRACQLAGLSEVPAIVRRTGDGDLLRDALLENLHRAQLNPLEEAAAYRQLLDDFACTQEQLSVRVARSRPQISNTLRLLKLPPLVQRRVAAGVISAGHARALLGLTDAAAMERLAQRVVAEGLSVRSTEELVSLGEIPAPAKERRPTVRPGGRHEALDVLQEHLTDKLDTKVTVTLGKTKGRITIEFASVADLNRILAVMDPEGPGVLR